MVALWCSISAGSTFLRAPDASAWQGTCHPPSTDTVDDLIVDLDFANYDAARDRVTLALFFHFVENSLGVALGPEDLVEIEQELVATFEPWGIRFVIGYESIPHQVGDSVPPYNEDLEAGDCTGSRIDFYLEKDTSGGTGALDPHSLRAVAGDGPGGVPLAKLVVHELGHALGLRHTFSTTGSSKCEGVNEAWSPPEANEYFCGDLVKDTGYMPGQALAQVNAATCNWYPASDAIWDSIQSYTERQQELFQLARPDNVMKYFMGPGPFENGNCSQDITADQAKRIKCMVEFVDKGYAPPATNNRVFHATIIPDEKVVVPGEGYIATAGVPLTIEWTDDVTYFDSRKLIEDVEVEIVRVSDSFVLHQSGVISNSGSYNGYTPPASLAGEELEVSVTFFNKTSVHEWTSTRRVHVQDFVDFVGQTDHVGDLDDPSLTLPTPYDAVAFDYDGDGREDLFVSDKSGPGALYRNEPGNPGLPTFRERTNFEFAQGEEPQELRGLAIGDFDSDGDRDVFGAAKLDGGQGIAARLYELESDPNGVDFTDIAATTGTGSGTHLADLADNSWTALWADVNHDGLLDLFVGQADDTGVLPEPDLLMKNLGKGAFADIAGSAKINLPSPLATLTAGFGRMGRDPHQELFIGDAGTTGARMLRVKSYGSTGNPEYESLSLPASYTKVVGSSWADLDNDGFLDLVLARNETLTDNVHVLWGDGSLDDDSGAEADGFEPSPTEWTTGFVPAGVLVADLDLSGSQDLLLLPSGTAAPLLLANVNPAQRSFADRTTSAGLDLHTEPISGAVAADFGGSQGLSNDEPDGDPDLYLGRVATSSEAYYQNLNSAGLDDPENNWLQVKLDMSSSSRHWPETGTLVWLESAGTSFGTQLVDHGLGRRQQEGSSLHLSLGQTNQDVDVVVRWPDGKEDRTTVSPANFNNELTLSASHSPGVSNVVTDAYLLSSTSVKWVFTWHTDFASEPERDLVTVTDSSGSCPGGVFTPATAGVTHSVVPSLSGGYIHTLSVVKGCQFGCSYTVTCQSEIDGRVSSSSSSFNVEICGNFQQ